MKPIKLFFIIVLLVWMVSVFFGCKERHQSMNEIGNPELLTSARDLLPMLIREKLQNII